MMQPAHVPTIFDEVTDFLASAPSAEAIIGYTPSEELIARAQELLQRRRDDTLTPDERAEMDEFIRMEHFMTMLKLKTRLNLAS
jgi:PAS domain-containing protein